MQPVEKGLYVCERCGYEEIKKPPRWGSWHRCPACDDSRGQMGSVMVCRGRATKADYKRLKVTPERR